MGFSKRAVFIALSLAVFWAGCRKPSSANWDTDLTIPLVKSHLNIKNFLGDTLFDSDNNQQLYLNISREIAALKLDSLFVLPDTSIVTSFTNPIPFYQVLTPGQSFNQFLPADLSFNIANGVMLKRVDVRTCQLTVKFSNSINQPLELVYQIPSAIRNGNVFTIKETVPPGNNSLIKTYDLSGYSLDLRGQKGNQFNTIVQTYTMALSNSATANDTLYYADGAKIELTYSEVVPDYFEGYFGQQSIDIEVDTVDFGFVKNFRASNFMLSEATMDFKLLNEFGAEFSGSLYNINAINSIDSKTVGLQTNQLSAININRANRSGNTIFPSIKQILLNNGNSNVAPFISTLPNRLTYQGNIQLNPLGNISAYNDFAYYNTGLKVVADIRIPIKFKADYFSLTTETDVNFSSLKQLDKMRNGNFILNASNGFPFDATIQVYLLDVDKRVIDSLAVPGGNHIERGLMDNNYLVVSPVKSQIYFPVSPLKVDNLKKCNSLRIVSHFMLPSGQPEIKILDYYAIDLNIIAELTYNMSN